MKIALVAPHEKKDLKSWVEFLKADVNPISLESYSHVIDWTSNIPVVKDSEGRRLVIDFDEDHITYQRKQLRGKNEPLAKALGLGKGVTRVLDLSVGMAADSVLLSQLGFQVRGVERSPLLYFLLMVAFENSQREELRSYQLSYGNSLDFLSEAAVVQDVQAIYFDPMYPKPEGKKKTALPKQEMVIFRGLVGDDLDADQVLEKALNVGVSKVVVKRPIGAEILGQKLGYKPSYSLETKVVRFDVYVR